MNHIYSRSICRFPALLRRNGLRTAFLKPARSLLAPWIIARLPPHVFQFRGQTLNAFYGRYNTTWVNERCMEIPIARAFLQHCTPDETLEIGNVLGHYGDVGHDVLDKFERGPRVMNEDICHFSPSKQYSRIVSISTFEHIGFDDDGHSRPEEALDRCVQWLKPAGRVMITAPLGYNPAFDALIASGWPCRGEATFLKRKAWRLWQECDPRDALQTRYGMPFPYANGLVVITVAN